MLRGWRKPPREGDAYGEKSLRGDTKWTKPDFRVAFEGGTYYCNPLHLADRAKDADYILFIEPAPASQKDELTLLEADNEIRNWLRSRPHDTSYGAIEAYINQELT